MVDTRDLKSLAGNRVPVRVRSPAPEKGKSEQDFPFSGAAPSARTDPLRSNAKEDSRPLSRSSHADLKVGSDLDCPGAPCQKNAALFRFRGLRKSIATREKRATFKACRENCTFTESFFLSNSEVSRGTSELV